MNILKENGKLKLANLITVLRLILIVPILWLLLAKSFAAALGFYLAAILTDVLDGWVARIEGSSSEFGAQLDGFVDNVFSIFIFAFLYLAFPELISRHPFLTAALFGAPFLYLAVSFVMARKFMMYHFLSAKVGAFLLFCIWPALAWWHAEFVFVLAAVVITFSRLEQIFYLARGGRNLQAPHGLCPIQDPPI